MTDIIEADYNWKQAATQEGVDYGAVQKSFMDQSYGVVANKAKVLFQDPFRLGFEIVNRNEKATKMVGIFAFRVNKKLLYVPTFFVNGEIKAADMLYRADVKRFVPLTEDWCAYLVRGVEEQSGSPVDRNRRRQPDAYMDRLAYPQRVKYASELSFAEMQEKAEAETREYLDDKWAREMERERVAFVKAAHDGTLWKEILTHCADASPLRKLLPEIINENGPEALNKVASLVEASEFAERYLVSHYSKEELETVTGWMAKEASTDAPQPAILINIHPGIAKSAAEKALIFDKGYALIDKRPVGSTNVVFEEIHGDVVKELAAPGHVRVMLNGGGTEDAYLFRLGRDLLNDMPYGAHETSGRTPYESTIEYVYFPASKELLKIKGRQEVFGDELGDWSPDETKFLSAKTLKVGKCYAAVSAETHEISEVFHLTDRSKDGASTCLSIATEWEASRKVYYAPGRERSQDNYISDETRFIEVDCEITRSDDTDEIRDIQPKCDKALMSGTGLDQWMRTAGGLAESSDVRVKAKSNMTFDIEHRAHGKLVKAARDLGMLEAHLMLAEDFALTTDAAGAILDKAVDKDVTYRIYDSISKSAYLTRTTGMEEWIKSFDPELNVRLDTPQYQILTTYTPRRPDQQARYGDTYQRVPFELNKAAAMLPMDMIMSQSPEQLAKMSELYDMPHIFDHGCVGQMATTSHNIVEQIKKYIPDLEKGLDRYFRILFLLRYRPSDFEELYGKDDLIDFEDSLTELSSRAGEQVLRMLQQFSPDQYTAQEN